MDAGIEDWFAAAGRREAELLDVDRLEQVRRETPAGTALDTLLWGRRRGR